MKRLLIELILAAFLAAIATLLNQRLGGRREWAAYLKSAGFYRECLIITGICLLTLWEPRLLESLARRATARYSFEDQNALAWRVPSQDDCAQRGCALREVAQADEHVKDGDKSLAVEVHLLGMSPGQYQGEVWVDTPSNPPRGYQDGDTVSLIGRMVSAQVYVPASHAPNENLVSKYDTIPGYLQLFFETCGRNSERINSQPVQIRSGGDYQLKHWFGPWDRRAKAICRIGIKLGLNPKDDGVYNGQLFVDNVDWGLSSWWKVTIWIATPLLLVALVLGIRRWRQNPSHTQRG